MPRTAATPSGFRSDIQGMRALAVGVVILAHAGFRTFSGGFVGVDVFFVISGFLITSLLVREATRDQRISLVGFYVRRARRILPAAVLVTVVTVVASIALLPLVRGVEIIKDSIWSSLFLANVRFASVGTDYFAQGEASSPLQHYWSLSVEEQYYLVWPLVLIGCLALARRRGHGLSRTAVLTVLGVVGALSLAWSVYQTHSAPTEAYFSTLTRAWELAAGSAAAVALSGRGLHAPRWVAEAMSLLGLGAIVVATFAFTGQTPFPGYAAALPVAGAVLLLVAGSGPAGEATTVYRLLSVRPARVLGDWSYSLYLWHWPVLRIAEDRLGEGRLPLPTLAAALVVILVLSAATYRFVETPFRTGRRWSRPRFGLALYPVSLVLVLAVGAGGRTWVADQLGAFGDNPGISASGYAGQGLSKDPQVALVQASVLAAQDGQAVPSDLRPPLLGLRQATAPLGDCDYRTGTTRLCPMGDSDADRSIALIGDSHARAWSPAIDQIGRDQGYATYNFVYSGCSASTVVQGDRDTGRPWQACEDFKAWVLSTLRTLKPDVIVVSTSAVSPIVDDGGATVGMVADRSRFEELVAEGFGGELDLLTPLAPRVEVIGDTPKLPREPGVCLTSGDVDLGDCLFERGPVNHRIQQSFADEAKARGVPFVNASPWFCYQGLCPSVVGSTITMRDSEHVTPEYARDLAGPLARKLGLTGS